MLRQVLSQSFITNRRWVWIKSENQYSRVIHSGRLFVSNNNKKLIKFQEFIKYFTFSAGNWMESNFDEFFFIVVAHSDTSCVSDNTIPCTYIVFNQNKIFFSIHCNKIFGPVWSDYIYSHWSNRESNQFHRKLNYKSCNYFVLVNVSHHHYWFGQSHLISIHFVWLNCNCVVLEKPIFVVLVSLGCHSMCS